MKIQTVLEPEKHIRSMCQKENNSKLCNLAIKKTWRDRNTLNLKLGHLGHTHSPVDNYAFTGLHSACKT